MFDVLLDFFVGVFSSASSLACCTGIFAGACLFAIAGASCKEAVMYLSTILNSALSSLFCGTHVCVISYTSSTRFGKDADNEVKDKLQDSTK